MPYVYPNPPENPSCAMLLVPTELVPIVGAAFSQLEKRNRWVSYADWQQGYLAFTELQAQLMNSCLTDLIQEIRDFRGVKPVFASVPVEDRTSAMYNDLNDILQSTIAMRGLLSDGWFEDQFATLADIVQAQRGTDKTNGIGLWETIAGILSAGGSLASVIDFITDLLTSQEEVVVEGGLLIALCALTAANSGIMQTQMIQQDAMLSRLTLILETMRGGTQPTDNIVQILRGETVADNDRNIADLLT